MKLYRISESRLRKEILEAAERRKDKEFNEFKERAENAINGEVLI